AVLAPTRRRVPEYPAAARTDASAPLVPPGAHRPRGLPDPAALHRVPSATGARRFGGSGRPQQCVGHAHTVRVADAAGPGLLADPLVGLGHRETAHVGGVGAAVARERAEAFGKAMERHGLGELARVEPGDFTEQVGQTAGSMLLRGSQVPTAGTCANGVTA